MSPRSAVMQSQVSPPSSIVSSRVEFDRWVHTSRPGSLYLDSEERLYVKTVFGHHRIQQEPVKFALVYREREIVKAIKRNRSVIRWLFTMTVLLSAALVWSIVA